MNLGRTPFFLVDEQRICDSVAAVRESLARHWPNSVLSFSVKTNSLPCVLETLRKLGVWAEVVSQHEYELAGQCGFAKENCVCNGPAKSDEFIREALQNGALLHLDDLHEVRTMLALVGNRPMSFGVRVNATELDFPAEPLCGTEGSRFGLSVRDGDMDELMRILANRPNVHLTSLHLHCNTRGRRKEGFAWLASFFARIVKTYRLTEIDTFDIGGSFGHDFDHPGDGAGRWPSWNEYFSSISAALEEGGFSPSNLRLVIEPGSALISNAAEYHATLLGSRVIGGRRFMQMDGSRVHVDPHFARASFAGGVSVIPQETGRIAEQCVAICGATCLEKDRVGFGDGTFTCAKGDHVIFEKAGAYTFGMSPVLFINPAPDVWFRQKDGGVSLVNLGSRDFNESRKMSNQLGANT